MPFAGRISTRHAWTASVLAVACVLATFGVGVRLLRDVRGAQDWVTHTVEVQLQAERLRTDLRGLGRAVLDRLVVGQMHPEDTGPWRVRLRGDLDALAALVRDNPAQSGHVETLRKAIDVHLGGVARLTPGDAVGLAARRERAAAIEQAIADFQSVEAHLLSVRRTTLDEDLGLHMVALGSLGGVALGVVVIAAILSVKLVRARAREESAVEKAVELAQAHRRARYFAQQLLEVEEAERRAIARELHDDLAQRLAALKLNLQLTQQGNVSRSDTLDAAIGIADLCIDQVRQRAVALRPQQLDELGLGPALTAHVEEQARLAGVEARIDVGLAPDWKATPVWSAHVFRIVQEAVRNAIVHGQPRRIDVCLRAGGGRCVLTVDDDGKGLPPQRAPGLGLAHMRERTEMLGGRFDIQPRPEGGTRVTSIWETGGEPDDSPG